ncbi:ligand-binding sensor domain-containing protein [Flammeovirga pacifica]|uniref:ligand-binding sensor domain-containing protein n=1 Tax=Flammeovirga pacifica TaxID=915059 RepID=UPI0005C7486C|nr:two-component regulator propeller domain-containing protein [Flammeovirga pacifica]
MKTFSLTYRIILYYFFTIYSTTLGFDITNNSTVPTKLTALKAKQGLSHNNVTALVQDKYGILWIGTDDGLNIYDGNSITTFQDNSEIKLTFNSIRTLSMDSLENKVWIGTNGSLEYYDYGENKFYRETIIPQDNIIEDVCKILWDDDHKKIVGVSNQGVYREREYGYTLISEETSHIYSIERINSTLYIASNKGISVYDLATDTYLDQPQLSFLHQKQIRLLEAFGDTLYIGTAQGDIFIFNKGVLEHVVNTNHSIKSITKDKQGIIWVGTESHGAYTLIKEKKKYRLQKVLNKKISAKTINFIYAGNDNIIWLGSFGNGLLQCNLNDPFFTIGEGPIKELGLNNGSVTSIENDAGKIWIGTDGGGIHQVDLSSMKITSFLKNKSILSVQKVKNTVWVGTYKDGLFYSSDRKRFKKLIRNDQLNYSIEKEVIWDILNDNDTLLWMATSRGVIKYNLDNGLLKRYEYDESNTHSLSNNDCRKVYKDIKGDIWIGSFHGLNRYCPRTDEFKRLYFNNKASDNMNVNNAILSIYEDEHLNFWVGTFGKGLWRLNRQDDLFEEEEEINKNLPSLFIYGIESSADNFLWLSSNKGISAYNVKTGQILNYNEADGLQGPQFNVGASAQFSNELLAFGGTNGVNFFYPQKVLNTSVKTLQPIIKKLIIHASDHPSVSKKIYHKKSITLQPDERNFSFEYAVVDFKQNHKLEFQTRLLGFDKHWQTSKNTFSSLYSNFEVGTYTFQVRARYPHQEWGKIQSFQINLSPFFYERIEFKIVCIVLLLITLYGVYRWTLKRTHLRNDRVEEIINQRLKTLISEEQVLSDLENQQSILIRETLEKREKELTTHALRLLHLTSLIEQLDEKLLHLQTHPEEFSTNKIKSIRRDIKNAENLEKEWEILNQLFAEVHQPFIKELQELNKGLTEGNLRLCYLIRLKMNTKDIASIMGISINSVKVARKRLRKRLELPTDISLNDYIFELG